MTASGVTLGGVDVTARIDEARPESEVSTTATAIPSDVSTSPWRPTRSQVAWGIWVVVFGVTTWRWGLPRSRPQLFLVLGLALFAATAGNRRGWMRIVRDWLPLFVILSVYDFVRGEAQFWGTVHVVPQIDADRWLFGGVPTVWLQHHLFTPGIPHWWDYGVFFVYLSHFFVALDSRGSALEGEPRVVPPLRRVVRRVDAAGVPDVRGISGGTAVVGQPDRASGAHSEDHRRDVDSRRPAQWSAHTLGHE